MKEQTVSRWYKQDRFWRRKDNNRSGTGDIIFNTLTKIILDGDRSLWAVMAFIKCAMLLIARKRWPNDLNTGYEAPNRIVWFILRITKKLFNKPNRLYKPQSRMSRDPFIALGACYEHLLSEETEYEDIVISVFESVTLPWYLYSHNTWQWWRRLKKDNRKDYVIRLTYLRALATTLHFERDRKLWYD